MNLLQFLISFIMLLFLGAAMITGFYIITRGQKAIQPDGKYYTTGKIFKRWSLFWEQTTGRQKIYYCGEQLKEKYHWITEYNPDLGEKLKLAPEKYSMEIVGNLKTSDILYIKEQMHVEVMVNAPNVFLYHDDPVYRFPEWLRYPLSQCPPCMASVGGTLLYWPVVWLAGNNLFFWSPSPLASYFFFWVLFCLALSALNKLAYNITGS